MHGVRRSLLEAQAESIGLPLWQIPLPWPCTNEDYEARMAEACRRAVDEGFGSIAFGGDPLATPVVSDGLVFVVTTGGVVTAVPDGCSPGADTCSRPWSNVLDAGARSSPAVTSTGVFVGDNRGTLYAFGLPQD
jgi:outer membrane protein assembly factor BamB